MEKFKKNNDQFEKYQEDSLSSDEKKAVEDLLISDIEYAKEFEQYKLLIDGIKHSGRKNFRERISEWDQEMNEEGHEKVTNIRSFSRYYIAASIAFFLVVSFVLYFNLGSDNLYSDYYTAYNYDPGNTRGRDSEFSRISQLYEMAKYQEVIAAMNDIPLENQTETLKIALACSYMELEKYEEAIVMLQKISSSKGGHETTSIWYLSLCYLATDKPELSVPLLTKLAGMNSSYTANAKKLLAELE